MKSQFIHVHSLVILACFVVATAVDISHGQKRFALHPSSSGLYLAYNRAHPETWGLVSENLRKWASAKNQTRRDEFRNRTSSFAFTYIDTFPDPTSDNFDIVNVPESVKNVIKVVERKYTRNLCDKKGFAIAAKNAQLEGIVSPRTFTSTSDAVIGLSKSETDIVFVKDVTGTKGKGISIVGVEDVAKVELKEGYVIQEGLTRNLFLSEGRKVTMRMYFVILKGSIYVPLHDGGVQVQSTPYDSISEDFEVHVSHSEYVFKLLTEFPDYLRWSHAMAEMGKKAAPMLKDVVKATAEDPLRFSLLGVDVIPFADGTVKMVEINSYPAILESRADLLSEIILKMIGMEGVDDEIDSRMVKVWDSKDITEQHEEL